MGGTDLLDTRWTKEIIKAQAPYVKITLLGSGNHASTKPKEDGGLNPVWTIEDHNSLLTLEAEIKDKDMLVQVWAKNNAIFKDRLIGETIVSLHEFTSTGNERIL